MAQSETVSVEGHRIKLTNLDKVLYQATGTTKADVLAYLAEIAPHLIAHAANRPATRKRWVNGTGGEMFFQKNLDDSTPSWVKRRTIEHSDHSNEYPLVNDLATLTWLGQIAALEIHVPQWQFGRTGVRHNPDRLVLDLDPGPGVGLAECAEVARWARAILHDMGLNPMPVTSGSKGIHLYAALDGKQGSEAVSAVAHELARALEADHPDLVVSDMKKSIREGKVLVDWSQNNGSKTTVAPYSLRGRERPTVAAPRTWKELEASTLTQLEYPEVLARVKKDGDPLASLTAGHLQALEPTTDHQARFATTPVARDRLEKYRSMRDAAKTPEPVPAAAPGASTGDSFVIQEHHASRLHWDFRLEHDGVLVSWALPKGVPTDVTKNHLAVQTEDHPLEYGTFEGTIPKDEYGGGEVTIWDSGSYELEKWRDGEEVIATLHGERHGTHKYALIHTRGFGTGENNWLIHLMKEGASARQAKKRTVVGGGRHRSKSTVAPMLATLGAPGQLSDDDDWAYEMKWDGIRAIAEITQGEVTLTSRNGNDLTKTYPELQSLAEAIDDDAVIDGEIVALGATGRPDFGRLQERMNLTKSADVEKARAKTTVHFMAFDLLRLGSDSLVKRHYDDRRQLLERHVRTQGEVQVPPAFDGDEPAAMRASLELGLEGVVAKKRDSTYLPGKRSRSWVKLKHHRTQEVVVGGWREGKGARANRVGALLLGIPGPDGIDYVGKVGTGFGDRELDAMLARFAKLERATSPLDGVPSAEAKAAHWIRPSLVGEVEFSEWTATGRLRQPSWRGWRSDKKPADVHRE
jgi:bifunctional non-homologous end joining protein LigD